MKEELTAIIAGLCVLVLVAVYINKEKVSSLSPSQGYGETVCKTRAFSIYRVNINGTNYLVSSMGGILLEKVETDSTSFNKALELDKNRKDSE